MAYAANPFKHQLQGETYAAMWKDLRERLKRYRTVKVVKGAVKAASAPATVYVLKIGKAVSKDAFTALEDAKSVAQSLATRYDLPVGVMDKKNRAVVAQRGSARRSAATFGMSRNPSKKRRSPAAKCWWCVHDQHGRVLAKSTSKPTILAYAQREANKLGKALGVGKM